MLVLGIGPHVLGEHVDALGQDGNLNLGRAGIGLVGAVGVDDRGLFFLAKHSVVSTFRFDSPQHCAPGR